MKILVLTIQYNEFINNPICIEEVIKAKNKLKNNKACGPDNIINEFLKYCPDMALEVICKFFNIILDTGIIPTSWTIGYIIPIFKNKGSKDDPNNYRGITLLSAVGKLFTSILNNRLTNYIENVGLLGEDQAGFRAGYSTLDHAFVLNNIINLYLSNKKRVYCALLTTKRLLT
jgi:hypothetical protein